jgi:hypothetical protein
MNPEETLALKVLARVVEYLQTNVSKTIPIDSIRVFVSVALSRGACSMQEAIAQSGKPPSSGYLMVKRLQADYEQGGKKHCGHNLVVIRENPADARASEVVLSEHGKRVVKVLSEVFTSAMAGRPMLRKGAG